MPSVKGADLGPVLFSDPGALEMRCRYLTIWISLGPLGLIRSTTVSALLNLNLLLCVFFVLVVFSDFFFLRVLRGFFLFVCLEVVF